MTKTEVVKCVFNDYWSLVWDYHEGCWCLRLHQAHGNEGLLWVSPEELQPLIDLMEVYKGD